MDKDVQDDFDDDFNLDELPDDALNELEYRALRSTQQKPTLTSVAYDQLAVNGHQVQEYVEHEREKQFAHQPGPETDYVEPPSSDYGFDDEDVIDLDAHPAFAEQCFTKPARNLFDEVIQREQWRQQRYVTPARQGQREVQQFQPAAAKSHAVEPYTRDQLEKDVAEEESHRKQESIPEAPQFDVALLQARIKEVCSY